MLGQVTPIPIIQVSMKAEGYSTWTPDGDKRLCTLHKFRVKMVNSREIHWNRFVLQNVTLSFGCLRQRGGLCQMKDQRKGLCHVL